jgi:hypothetical protein
MKRFFLLLCFFAMFHGVAASQDASAAEQDRLKPAESFYDANAGILDSYYRVIKDHLISTGEGRFMSRFWMIPSFSKEYFMGTKQEGEEFFLICREPEKHIWTDGVFYSDSRRRNYSPRIVEIKRSISKSDVRSLNLLIEVAVIGARFDQTIRSDKDCYPVTMGTDGTNYYFSTHFDWPRTATVWSPRENSKTGELVAILEEVIGMAKNGGKGPVEFTPEFRARLAELTKRFQDDI